MPCAIENGILLDCKYTVGGINRIYLANYAEWADSLITTIAPPDPNEGGITQIQPAPGGLVFYPFEFQKDQAGANMAIQGKGGAGSVNFTHTITALIGRFDQQIINEMKRLGLSNVVALVESRNKNNNPTEPSNRWFIFGGQNGIEISAMEGGLGQVATDLAGFNVTLTGAEVEPAVEIAPDDTKANVLAIINPLLAP